MEGGNANATRIETFREIVYSTVFSIHQKVEFYCAQLQIRSFRCEMHFSHDIKSLFIGVINFYCTMAQRIMVTGGGCERIAKGWKFALLHVFLLLFLSGSRREGFFPQLLSFRAFRGCTAFMLTTKIINYSG